MKTNVLEYKAIVDRNLKPSQTWKNTLFAFLTGGTICTVGQGIYELLCIWYSKEDAFIGTPVIMVFLGILFTALSLYHKLALYGGAGTLVPITGFANAIASEAIEFKTEGLVLGLAAKMFVIAGPVLVYGISSAVIYGVIYYILKCLGV